MYPFALSVPWDSAALEKWDGRRNAVPNREVATLAVFGAMFAG
jgi:hypothetical protein